MNTQELVIFLIDKYSIFELLIFLVAVFSLTDVLRRFFSRQLPSAYSIAVVGLPRSGKTTLITRSFNEIFSRKILGIKLLPKGSQTIERVNLDIENLETGKKLGPTTDQDLFAYRANIEFPSIFPFRSRNLKVEFGDFPGEDSEELSSEENDWLHNTPFFKWVMEADSIIFVVDLAHYLSSQKNSTVYKAKVSKAIRAAWQHINEYHEKKYKLKKMPIVLAFTKSDLFSITTEAQDIDEVSKAIIELGFEKAPPIVDINKRDYESGKVSACKDFNDLISFLSKETSQFDVVFVSCFGRINGNFIGIAKMLKKIIPFGRSIREKSPIA